MKTIALTIMALLMASFVFAGSITAKPVSVTSADVFTPSHSQHGGSSSCKTLWAWNGYQYIKRDVVVKQNLYKGSVMNNIKGNIQVAKVTSEGLLLNIIVDGDQCGTLNQKPKTAGLWGVSDDISVLPFQFWKD